ncbi:MAG: glycosyl hydrolase family 2 [bacterium]|nr:MAG: glycosyl hydrolase family 2 [bacterium]
MIKSFNRVLFILFLMQCAIIFFQKNIFAPNLHARQNFSSNTSFFLPPLFQDNMILQQRTKVSFWGKGIPGTRISVAGSWGKKAAGVVLPDSSWAVKLTTPRAGGPYEVTIQYADSLLVLNNVLIGEVWLCSGQSNMEMPLEGWPPADTIRHAAYEIENATFPQIRLFLVKRNYSATLTSQCSGQWEECSPTTVRSFSATAYFFGRKLLETLNVPVGLIEAAWGGTPVESWISKKKLAEFEEFAATLKTIEQVQHEAPLLDRWLADYPSINVDNRNAQHRWENLFFKDENCSATNLGDNTWDEMTLPTLWEKTALGNFDGAVWFRKEIKIPSNWIGRALVLHLGPIDDMDETYVNGVILGSTLKQGFWQTDRIYSIPDSVVQDSVVHIAVRVIDTQGGGGIWGDQNSMFLLCDSSEQTISLAGSWKYLPVAEYRAGIFSIFGGTDNRFKSRPKLPIDFSAGTPTALFNGMINPIIPFTIKGVIWYQGEANVNNPSLYSSTFPALISDWRGAFGVDNLPFYFVQIAPFRYGSLTASQKLREAQFHTLKIKNTGMAVTLDIADPVTIHPANKADVGERLALWALAKTYKKKGFYSGPLYKSMKIAKQQAILSFDYAGKRLVIKPINGEHNFTIAGEDSVFQKANVKVAGKKLIVFHPEISRPLAVRYAWSNTDRGTLFNQEGLPASSFRTDNWEK